MVYLLLAVFTFVALAPLCSVAWRLIDGNREALKTSQQEYQLLLASTISRELDIHVESLGAQLVRASYSLALASGRVDGGGDAAVRLALEEAVDERMRYLRFTDLRGRMVSSAANATIPEEIEPSFRAGFRAMAESLLDQRPAGAKAAARRPSPGITPRAAIVEAPVISREGSRRRLRSGRSQAVWDAVMASHTKAARPFRRRCERTTLRRLTGITPGRHGGLESSSGFAITPAARPRPCRSVGRPPRRSARPCPRSYESREGWGRLRAGQGAPFLPPPCRR
jgi:hypothetical protein